ncbi:MAG TPA: glycosyltransferase, partial [Vicinamibacterales bacterium]|nr:glycosyltransferase [Vicinamibacterales bacterium]
MASPDVPQPVTLLVPGDLNLRTGGYGYDREIVAGLRALGWRVDIAVVDGSFPYPTAEARAQAARTLAALSDGALVLADGLAFGAMAEEAEHEAARLRLVELVHHPLADETGVAAEAARGFLASERRALACTRGVIVTSPATGRRVAEFGVPSDRIWVVPPGTAPAPQARGTRGVDADSGGTVPPVELLCVATFVPRKGHDVLIGALARL